MIKVLDTYNPCGDELWGRHLGVFLHKGTKRDIGLVGKRLKQRPGIH